MATKALKIALRLGRDGMWINSKLAIIAGVSSQAAWLVYDAVGNQIATAPSMLCAATLAANLSA